MRQIIVSEWMTLDGVFDSDPGFFDQWFIPYHSDSRAEYIQETVLSSGVYLLGRKTYETLAPYWSSMKNNEMGIADKLNSMPKYVVSSTLKKAGWNNSTIISENVVEEITKLKQQSDGNILISGSGELVRSLTEVGLIDEYRFLVHPVIMGNGKRFFREGMSVAGLKLTKTEQLDLGVMLLYYQPTENE